MSHQVEAAAGMKFAVYDCVVCIGFVSSKFNETTTTISDDRGNVTAAERRGDNSSLNGSDDAAVLCQMVGTGWLSWYPAVRPAFGFVVYYVIPTLLYGVLYGRVVRTLLTTSSQWSHAGSADHQQLKRRHAARSIPHHYCSHSILSVCCGFVV